MPTERITTNHRFVEPLTCYDLSKKELQEFDYMDEETLETTYFVRTRGCVYSFLDFQRLSEPVVFHGIEFCGYHNPSIYEAILVAINNDGQVCTAYSRTI